MPYILGWFIYLKHLRTELRDQGAQRCSRTHGCMWRFVINTQTVTVFIKPGTQRCTLSHCEFKVFSLDQAHCGRCEWLIVSVSLLCHLPLPCQINMAPISAHLHIDISIHTYCPHLLTRFNTEAWDHSSHSTWLNPINLSLSEDDTMGEMLMWVILV